MENLNTTEVDTETDTQERVSGTDAEELWRRKIIHTLTWYPKLNPSMLQVGIGTAIPRTVWGPVLEQMIAEGIVREEKLNGKGPTGRDQSYTILSLAA